MKKFGWVISLIICLILGIFFGYIYFHDHSYGASGDDSAGYIFLWGLMNQHKPLVYQEPLTVKALDFFQDEKLARWTTPTHHEIISPAGYIASKYPIGLSLLMYLFSSLLNLDLAIYYVMPLFAALNLIIIYLISNLIFKNIKWRYFFSFLAAAIVGLANLYYTQAISQPMREIPSTFFILLSFYLLLWAIESPARQACGKALAGGRRHGILFYLFLFLSAIILGFSFNVRETSLIVVPAFILLFWKLKFATKKKLTILGLLLIFLLVGVIPSIINSYNISIHKEKFKKKDITSVAITSNFDHIRSFSLSNLLNNNGKFRSGEQGGLGYYWQIMQNFSVWPVFLSLVFLGLIFLFYQDKFLAGSLSLWGLGVLLLFSLWINPYNRYILPMLPVLAILSSYGLYSLIDKIVPYFFQNKKQKIAVSIIVILSLVIVYQPVGAKILENIKNGIEIENKSLTYDDLIKLKNLGEEIKQESQKTPLVVFSGTWQYGTSETFSSHTGIQAIRMPLEQKFDFKETEVREFWEKYLLTDYQVYVVTDLTTEPLTLNFLNNFSQEEKDNFSLSFDEDIKIYAITTKN
jgi:hypothetical protein